MASVRLAVIGMSGQGKSTFLNALADDGSDVVKEHFAVSNSSDACTTEVKRVTIQSKVNGHDLSLTIFDTMGFPDTDPKRANDFYDKVVAACSGELNAIIWVQKDTRKNFKMFETMKILMGEFNKASPPIFLLINGTQNYTIREQKQPGFAAKKQDDIANCVKLGQDLKEATGVAVTAIIPSCCKDDLYDSAKEILFGYLATTKPLKSNMKTSRQLREEVDACKSKADMEALAEKKIKEQKAKAEDNASRLQRTKDALQATSVGLVASAPLLALIPGVGLGVAAVAGVGAAAAKASIAAMEGNLKGAMEAAKSAVESLQQASSNKRKACDEFENVKKALDDLNAEFGGGKKMKTQ